MARHDDSAWRQAVYTWIGSAVRRKRVAAGLSGRQVAEKLRLAPQSVNMYEEGGGSIPLHFLIAFAQLMQCEISEFMPTDIPATFTRTIEKADT